MISILNLKLFEFYCDYGQGQPLKGSCQEKTFLHHKNNTTLTGLRRALELAIFPCRSASALRFSSTSSRIRTLPLIIGFIITTIPR